jgi:hypothetical protein
MSCGGVLASELPNAVLVQDDGIVIAVVPVEECEQVSQRLPVRVWLVLRIDAITLPFGSLFSWSTFALSVEKAKKNMPGGRDTCCAKSPSGSGW